MLRDKISKLEEHGLFNYFPQTFTENLLYFRHFNGLQKDTLLFFLRGPQSLTKNDSL